MKNRTFISSALLSALALAGSVAFAQTAPPANTTEQAKAKKVPTVWTDDNIGSLRSPEEIYLQQQQAKQEQQRAAAAQLAAKSSAQQGAYSVPVAKTPQEADQIIARDKQILKQQQDYIAQTKQQLATAPDSYKERLQWRIQSRSAIASRLQAQISDLEKQKGELEKRQPAKNGSASGASASAQN